MENVQKKTRIIKHFNLFLINFKCSQDHDIDIASNENIQVFYKKNKSHLHFFYAEDTIFVVHIW